MSGLVRIAREEWRLWSRSRVVTAAAAIAVVLLLATSFLTAERVAQERADRAARQVSAEETFFAQPDRHPHRMVHYGHYAFRPPPPLTAFEPGVDAVTGQSIFLEGHRQNTAMFADTKAAADLGGFDSLTPASLYQILVPLLLIVLGHALVLRERESGTLPVLLAQGQSGVVLVAGKAVALLAVVALALLPLAALAIHAVAAGESALSAALLLATYALYLGAWSVLILGVSLIARQRAMALAALVLIWLLFTLVVPRVAINSASALVAAPGKIESDLLMLAEQRQLGDGHNAADPAFAQLQVQILEQYGVETVEQLPINFHGVVAGAAEAELTELLNDFTERRMAQETAQAGVMGWFGLVSPTLAAASASRMLAGTDLATHHRFLREAESLRFDFVQGLNEVHATQLAYADDLARSSDPAAERRTRVDASAWRVLDDFRFTPDAAGVRAARAGPMLALLAAWLLALSALVHRAARRLRP